MIIVTNRAKIPIKLWNTLCKNKKRVIKSFFNFSIFNPSSCNLRYSKLCKKDKDNCKTCIKVEQKIRLFKKSKKFVYLPRGDKVKLRFVAGELKTTIKDKTVCPSVRKLKVNYSLFDERINNQLDIVNKWFNIGYGQISSPPRSGKTIVGTIITSKVRTRTLILASQKSWLYQFKNTFKKFTNIGNAIKINPSIEEVDDLIVACCTYQQFLRNPKKLKYFADKFGLVLVDESHNAPANCFSKILSKFKARYIGGLSATPNRKDGLQQKSELIIGPVVVIGTSKPVKTYYKVVNTNIEFPNYGRWTTLISNITKHEKRNDLIVKHICRDYKKGRKIVVSVDRLVHIKILYDKLIKKLGKKAKKKIAVYYANPNIDREKLLSDCYEGKKDILIAINKLITEGVDIPPFSHFYHILPLANKEKYYQRVSRVRTPLKDKPYAMIKIFVDINSASNACFNIIDSENERLGFINKTKNIESDKSEYNDIKKFTW